MELIRISGLKAFVLRSHVLAIQQKTLLDEYAHQMELAAPLYDALKVLKRPEPLEIHEAVFAEILLCRSVDNYLCYLGDLLVEIFTARPETMRSGQQERLDFILQFESISALVAALAERRVSELMYKGMRDLDSFFCGLGIPLFSSVEEADSVITFVELRNVVVHGRGIVNHTFKSRLPNYPAEIGDHVSLDYDRANEHMDAINASVLALDSRATGKFGLPTLP